MITSSKALITAFEDLGQRQSSTLPTWFLGRGAEYGTLTPYIHQICLTLLVVIFYKEAYGEIDRTKEDLIRLTQCICEKMKVSCRYEQAEKIIDSLMFSKSKQYSFAFKLPIFNVETSSWENFEFQYLVIDRDFSNLEDNYQVYMLSDEAQELVIKSHEIIEHMDLDMKQLITELLIKKGNLKQALRMLDALEFSVRKLINEEKFYRDELVRNPKRTIYKSQQRWGDQLQKVQEQFEIESNRFQQMNSILNILERTDSERNNFLALSRRLRTTKSLHDTLAKLVISNIRLEFQILNSEFEALWFPHYSSFRDTVWQNEILPYGFESPHSMLVLAESVLSPIKPFLLPLEWGIDEHHGLAEETIFQHPDSVIDDDNREPIQLDWDSIVPLWIPVFERLLKDGKVTLDYLQTLDEVSLLRWVTNREAFDFWITLGTLEEPIIISDYILQNSESNTIKLIQKVIAAHEPCQKLMGATLQPIVIKGKELIYSKKVCAHPFGLQLKEVNDNEEH